MVLQFFNGSKIQVQIALPFPWCCYCVKASPPGSVLSSLPPLQRTSTNFSVDLQCHCHLFTTPLVLHECHFYVCLHTSVPTSSLTTVPVSSFPNFMWSLQQVALSFMLDLKTLGICPKSPWTHTWKFLSVIHVVFSVQHENVDGKIYKNFYMYIYLYICVYVHICLFMNVYTYTNIYVLAMILFFIPF